MTSNATHPIGTYVYAVPEHWQDAHQGMSGVIVDIDANYGAYGVRLSESDIVQYGPFSAWSPDSDSADWVTALTRSADELCGVRVNVPNEPQAGTAHSRQDARVSLSQSHAQAGKESDNTDNTEEIAMNTTETFIPDFWEQIVTKDSIWNAIRTIGTDTHFRHHMVHVATVQATRAYGRVSDINTRVAQNVDDFVQETMTRAFERISRYAHNEGNYPVSAASDDMRDVYVIVNGMPVLGWYVRLSDPCHACPACNAHRKCTEPTYRWEFYTVRRVMFATARDVVARTFRQDVDYLETFAADTEDGGYGPSSAFTRGMIPVDMFGKRVTMSAVTSVPSAAERISPDVMALFRKIAEAAEESGMPVVLGNGNISTDAGNMLAILAGNSPTEMGRRLAYDKVRELQGNFDGTSPRARKSGKAPYVSTSECSCRYATDGRIVRKCRFHAEHAHI